MTTAADEKRRQELLANLWPRMFADIEVVEWPLEKLRARRDERLRRLLAHARENSPWHAKRLSGLDVDAVTGDDLTDVPAMTKDDLMEDWNDVVCDRRLTLDLANEHLSRVAAEGPGFLHDDYLVFATGGSTGTRGVYVWHADDFIDAGVASMRYSAWAAYKEGAPPSPNRASISSASAVHMAGTMNWIFWGDHAPTRPANTPLPELVAWLNEVQPVNLTGYASIISALANEALYGDLQISPRYVTASSEPIAPDLPELVERAWGIPITNIYASTECPAVATQNPGQPGLVVHEDVVIVEPVDVDGHPVPPGTMSDKVLLTSLCNRTMPLIRYEMSDQITVAADPYVGPGAGICIETVHGRQDDWFAYGDGIRLHPHAVRSTLAKVATVVEYQIRQTRSGLDVDVVTSGVTDTEAIARELRAELCAVGVGSPVVDVRIVPVMERHPETGKLRRFVPLTDRTTPSPLSSNAGG